MSELSPAPASSSTLEATSVAPSMVVLVMPLLSIAFLLALRLMMMVVMMTSLPLFSFFFDHSSDNGSWHEFRARYLDEGVLMFNAVFAHLAEVEVFAHRALVANSDDWCHAAPIASNSLVSLQSILRRGLARRGTAGGSWLAQLSAFSKFSEDLRCMLL